MRHLIYFEQSSNWHLLTPKRVLALHICPTTNHFTKAWIEGNKRIDNISRISIAAYQLMKMVGCHCLPIKTYLRQYVAAQDPKCAN